MMYVRWFFLAIVSFAFNLFCWSTAGLWGLVAAVLKRDRLPGILAFVHTHDAPVWGDGTDAVMPAGFFLRWWRATRWIMRNPGYRFDAVVLGIRSDRVFVLQDYETWPAYDWDEGKPKTAWWLLQDRNSGRRYFSWRRDLQIGGRFYLKLWFGWNYKNLAGYHPIKISAGPKRIK